MPHPDRHRPLFPPSYNLQVFPSEFRGTCESGADDYLSLRGFGLKRALSRLYGLNGVRIELPPSFNDEKRYDFALVLPAREGRVQVEKRFRKGLLDYFGLKDCVENRAVNSYVVTAGDEARPRLKKPAIEGADFTSAGSGRVSFVSSSAKLPDAFSVEEVASLDIVGSLTDFCLTLNAAWTDRW